jgi:RNA polymerase subunit RPABC4/transcription elongation factor Spt4
MKCQKCKATVTKEDKELCSICEAIENREETRKWLDLI